MKVRVGAGKNHCQINSRAAFMYLFFGLTNQMRRAAVSISSNLAEGCSRSSKVDYARFVELATGSVFEVVSQATISLNYQLSTINYSEPYADVLIISFPYCYRRFVRSL